ncbi:MAG: alkane 1-monooxygenase [Myxococcota bacterium]|nr:alkane 1-monooxygenase [Myxococcota bacterium]
MASADCLLEDVPEMAPSEISEIWLGHLMSFLIPLNTLAFVWTGPHRWYVALLFITPLAAYHWMDVQPYHERREPVETLPSWPFNMIVYLLAIVHFAVLVGLVRLFSLQSFFSFDMLMVFLLVGGSSGFSIITAHELIHRSDTFSRLLGRLMLSTVLYEHFYTEHLRGHHVRVGTSEDPATARFGESYREFWRRTVPGQFSSAWRLEVDRLAGGKARSFPGRLVENRVIQGVCVGWAGAVGVLYFFGPVAFFAYLLQALVAVRFLEAVNYFEHWGLERKGRRVQPADSWDTHSWFTYYGLIGLSRHADHHAQPTRPYEQLRVRDEAPILPMGYVGMVDLVLARNDEFIALATEELRARQLGPFAPGRESEPEEETVRETSWLERRWGSLDPRLTGLLLMAALVLAFSFGGSLEAGGLADWPLALARNFSILGIIAASLVVQSRVEGKVQNGWISWGCAFGLLFLMGLLSQPWLVA